MTDPTSYDQQFGTDGVYAWPADLDIARKLIKAAPYAESSFDCLDDYFFYEYLAPLDRHLFYDYPKDEAEQFAKADAKSRQKLFKEAINWPLPYLVASAVYNIFSTEVASISVWDYLLWPFTCFDHPLFDMLQAKRWDKVCKNKIRKGFKRQLDSEIRGYTFETVMWGRDNDNPWFTCEDFTSHIYSQDVLRCLDLVGIDQGLAESAVDQMFKLKRLILLHNVLCNDSSEMLGPEI